MDDVIAAIRQLDPGDASLWTSHGAPTVAAVEAVLGRSVTARQRDVAWAAVKAPAPTAEPEEDLDPEPESVFAVAPSGDNQVRGRFGINRQTKRAGGVLTLPTVEENSFFEAVPHMGGVVWRAKQPAWVTGAIVFNADGNYLPVCVSTGLPDGPSGEETEPHFWEGDLLSHQIDETLEPGDCLFVGTLPGNPDEIRVAGGSGEITFALS